MASYTDLKLISSDATDTQLQTAVDSAVNLFAV